MSDPAARDPFRQNVWKRARSRLFHLLFLIRRPMTLGVRAAVFNASANEVFLIRHTYVPGWQLPGGGVETGETMRDALVRELKEEGNIDTLGDPQLMSVHLNRHASRRDHVALYLVTEFVQFTPKIPDYEIAESGFFPLDALPGHTTPATRRRLAELFDGAAASQEW